MRNVVKSVLAAAGLLFFVVNSASAQHQKLAHVNLQEIITSMPETKGADVSIKKYTEDLEKQGSSMMGEYQQKLSAYQAAQKTMNDIQRGVKEKEIQDLGNRIQQFQADAQMNLSNKQKELYEPILKKAQDAVSAVAKENKYAYVFDSSQGALLSYPDSDNIIALVKKKLNLK